MTPDERREPDTIDYAARQRIAASAGVDSLAVSQLLRAYQSYRKAMKQVGATE